MRRDAKVLTGKKITSLIEKRKGKKQDLHHKITEGKNIGMENRSNGSLLRSIRADPHSEFEERDQR